MTALNLLLKRMAKDTKEVQSLRLKLSQKTVLFRAFKIYGSNSRCIMKVIKSLCFLICVIMLTPCFAQKEANVWITGDDYGFDFNYGRFLVFDRKAFGSNVAATSVSICNKETGELLFYSDGANVWNKNFDIMPNGKGIISGRLFGQHTLIIPMPGEADKYYLFTVKSIAEANDNGLYYSVIDMSLNGGLGDVIPGTKNTLFFPDAVEALTGTIHTNGRDFWLVTHERGTDRFVIFPVTTQGVGKPSFYSFGPAYDPFPGGVSDGCIQISPDRSMMAFNMNISENIVGKKNEVSPLELYDFDAGTGTISDRRVLGEFPSIQTILFSPDNSKLYMGSYNWEKWPPMYGLLYQFDLSAGSLGDIIQSQDSIKWGFKPIKNLPDTIVPLPSFKLQLGPDGRLYNGAMGIQQNENGVMQRVLFYLDRPNAPLRQTKPEYRYLDSPNNKSLRTDPYLSEQSFPNFMQYYFNGLEPVDNSITPDECANIKLTLYPNPTEDFLSVKSSIENCLFPARIKIYNALGQYLQEVRVVTEPFPKIDLRTYPSGIYFLVMETFNRAEVKKVVKK